MQECPFSLADSRAKLAVLALSLQCRLVVRLTRAEHEPPVWFFTHSTLTLRVLVAFFAIPASNGFNYEYYNNKH